MLRIDYTIPTSEPTMTVGEIRKMIADLPDDKPVTIIEPGGGWWLNINGFQIDDDEPSVMFTSVDDFDTRQW